MSATEFKVETESGVSISRKTGKATPWTGVRIRWRFVGERKWRKVLVVPDESQGQSVQSLMVNADEIVDLLAAEAENGHPGAETP